MPLPPVNAIFVHQKLKCIVIYQNQTLWQLPRMKLDSDSWQYRQPYTGEEGDLYLSNQPITDEALAQLIPIEAFPDSLYGLTLGKFIDWWDNNGYEWLTTNHTNNADSKNTDNKKNTSDNGAAIMNAEVMNTDVISYDKTIDNTQTTLPQAPPSKSPAPSKTNVFDEMLEELVHS